MVVSNSFCSVWLVVVLNTLKRSEWRKGCTVSFLGDQLKLKELVMLNKVLFLFYTSSCTISYYTKTTLRYRSITAM